LEERARKHIVEQDPEKEDENCIDLSQSDGDAGYVLLMAIPELLFIFNTIKNSNLHIN